MKATDYNIYLQNDTQLKRSKQVYNKATVCDINLQNVEKIRRIRNN